MDSAATRMRFRGALIGLAVGDALGTTVEFRPRGTFEPVTEMRGGGPFGLPPGAFTDDTSMALCLAASLVERRAFDPASQMRRYLRWWQEGYMSSTGECFDIGNTVAAALTQFSRTQKPFCGSKDPYSAGNGSLMRLAPVPMAYTDPREPPGSASLSRVARRCADSSRTTHGAWEAVDACRLLGVMLALALGGASRDEILRYGHQEVLPAEELAPAIAALAGGSYRTKTEEQIRGSGYAVHALEAALWCFARADSYAEAVLAAVNLGEDADTTAAICGQLAGAYWGEEGIPEPWRETLVMAEQIRDLADQLYELQID